MGAWRPGRWGWALMAVVLGACDASERTAPGPGEVPVASVAVEPKDGVWTGTLKVGQQLALAARARAADGSELPATSVVWSSGDPAVAAVDAAGLVEARAVGATEIRATIKGKTGTVVINVVTDVPEVALVLVSPQAEVLDVGQTRQYSARVFDAAQREIFGRKVTWSVSPNGVASIDSTGLLRALAHGYADVKATVEGRSGAVGLTVRAPDPTTDPVRWVLVSPGQSAVLRTQHVQLVAHTLGASGGELSGRAVAWSSEQPAIAAVDAQGRVQGLARGTARIRATSEGVSGYATVEVREVPEGPRQTYGLRGSDGWGLPYVDIGATTWTDASGVTHAAFYVVRGGTLRLDFGASAWTQTFVVETRLFEREPNGPAVATREVQDGGQLAYDFETGLPMLRSATTAGLVLRPQPHGPGEYLLSQSVLGTPAQRWIWVIE